MSLFRRLKSIFDNGTTPKREPPSTDRETNTSAVGSQLEEAEARLREFALVVTREETALMRLQEGAVGDQSAVDSWTRQATAAIATGKEDIARACLLRKRECEERSVEKAKQVSEQREVLRQLKTRYSAMEEELGRARQQFSDLSHRGEVADVTLKAGQAIHQLSSTSFESQLDVIRKDVALSEGLAEATAAGSRKTLDEELEELYKSPPASGQSRPSDGRGSGQGKEGSSK